jgi:small subunit ribosomal protein S17
MKREKKMRKRVKGKVVSDKMNKTIVVVSETIKKHPLYKKYYKHRTKHYVHDEKNEAKIGDEVLIEETRPLSKLKRWRLVSILKKSNQSN